jgi:hypothetical protein
MLLLNVLSYLRIIIYTRLAAGSKVAVTICETNSISVLMPVVKVTVTLALATLRTFFHSSS